MMVDEMGRRAVQKAVKRATVQARVEAIGAVLAKHQGNVVEAAKELKYTQQYIYLLLRTVFPKGALAKYKKKGTR